jgi:hypothetical protein
MIGLKKKRNINITKQTDGAVVFWMLVLRKIKTCVYIQTGKQWLPVKNTFLIIMWIFEI